MVSSGEERICRQRTCAVGCASQTIRLNVSIHSFHPSRRARERAHGVAPGIVALRAMRLTNRSASCSCLCEKRRLQMQRRYITVDVFTDRAFGGNPLAVVLDAGGLSTAQMQAIACEFNYSETTFVLPPRDSANDAQVRIFTVTQEIPFAGHQIGRASCRERV